MKDTQPITPITVRPLRVLGAIATSTILMFVSIFLIHEGSYQYRLWRAGGIWCATLEPNGTIAKSYGAEACGYE